MTLWPHFPFDPEETLPSYADRLSMLHTGRGMERLIRDLGIHVEHFVSGREDAVSNFANSIESQRDEILKNAIRVLPRTAVFRGEPVSKTFLSPRTLKYCPACVAEDGGPTARRFRLFWGFRHVQRCDKHNLWLVKSPNPKATNLRVALGSDPLGEHEYAPEDMPEYLQWMRQRFLENRSEANPWLDGQTMEQVIAASEMIGAILEFGHDVRFSKLSAAQTEEATDIGFSIYREGPIAVREALDTIRKTSPATAVQAGPLAYYGALYDWLCRRGNAVEPGPIKDILRDHIANNSLIKPNTRILGEEIKDRKFHALRSLSQLVEIPHVRLTRLLKKTGHIPEDASATEAGTMIFKIAEVVPLIRGLETAISLKDVPAYLGATKYQIEKLYAAGIVKPLIPRTAPGSVRKVVFGRDHLDEILGKILALSEMTGKSHRDLHPIAYACQRGAGSFEVVFSDVIEGRLEGFRHPEKVGIGAIYVDVAASIEMRKSA